MAKTLPPAKRGSRRDTASTDYLMHPDRIKEASSVEEAEGIAEWQNDMMTFGYRHPGDKDDD